MKTPSWILVSTYIVTSSCGLNAAPPKETAPSPASAASATTASVVFDPRTPADFSREWAAIATIPDETERRRAGLEMAPRWQGKRFQWEGFAIASLCQPEKQRCAVHVFDRAKATDPDKLGGFFPLLHFRDAGNQALRKACTGKTSCVVRFSGLLAEVSTDPELPLGMTFTEVEVLGGRDPAPQEAWFKDGPSFPIPKDYQPRPLSMGKEPPLPPLQVKVQETRF